MGIRGGYSCGGNRFISTLWHQTEAETNLQISPQPRPYPLAFSGVGREIGGLPILFSCVVSPASQINLFHPQHFSRNVTGMLSVCPRNACLEFHEGPRISTLSGFSQNATVKKKKKKGFFEDGDRGTLTYRRLFIQHCGKTMFKTGPDS